MTGERFERFEELVWTKLDGELSPEERVELEAHLAGHPEAQERERELAWLCERLDEVPDVTAPSELRSRIERALAARSRWRARGSRAVGNRRSFYDALAGGGWLPQLAFAAAGLLAGLLFYPILGALQRGHEVDTGQLYGVMGAAEGAAAPALRLELPDGSVALWRRGSVLFTELELRGSGDIELRLAFAAGALGLEAQNQTGAGSRLLVGADGLILRPLGAGRYELQINAEGAVLPLEVVVIRGGETIVARRVAWGDIPELPG